MARSEGRGVALQPVGADFPQSFARLSATLAAPRNIGALCHDGLAISKRTVDADMGGELNAPLMGNTAKPGTSVRGAVFVLANTILGAGMLGLPFAFAACGFLVGPCMLLFFACSSITALFMLAECADYAGRPANFNSVAERAMPGSGVLIDVAVAIKCFGVATSYLIVIGDSVPKSVVSCATTAVSFGPSTCSVQSQIWKSPCASASVCRGHPRRTSVP